MGTAKKTQQLGMPFGTANGRLRKSILFNLLRSTGANQCFQCGHEIESEEDLSIEHKVPWLDSENPKELFFDLSNVAFSHLRCNCAAARTNKGSCTTKHGTRQRYEKHGCRCTKCKEAKQKHNQLRKKRGYR